MLESLHHAGCERGRAGNRKLHMDHYMALRTYEMLCWLKQA